MNNNPTPPTSSRNFSVVVPCYNEEQAIINTLDQLHEALESCESYQVIIVDDGSTDGTGKILEEAIGSYPNFTVVQHEKNKGYGASIKTGIRRSKSEFIVITDADGTYPNQHIPHLVSLCEMADMVVGARIGEGVEYSKVRAFPKFFLRHWVSWISKENVPDINSGLRVFRKDIVEKFLGILPDSFSFTTTITLAMHTNYHRVIYSPIEYSKRVGKSKIKPVKDTLRFMQLILRTGTYFAPMRIFGPIVVILGLSALTSLAHDVFISRNLADTTVLLFLFSMNTGMFALLADMIDKRSS
jgi:glycosyltransferase involved in cell wall biosynthesis